MKVLNIMLSRELGGIQQSFLNYSLAMKMRYMDVINVTSSFAKINSFTNSIKVPNLGPWDLFSRLYLKGIAQFTKAQVYIAHGNRAITFASSMKLQPLIGVAHNYSIKHFAKCDYVIALTEHMKNYLIENGFPASKIFVLPNMIRITNSYVQKRYRNPVVIGTCARFVQKKGIDIFLQSLAMIKSHGYKFKAIIAGDGEEKDNLIKLANNLGLSGDVQFIPWVTDKVAFFSNIDIFCLPSIHEPFGITVLEALEHGTPVVATNSEGPSEILQDRKNGVLCEKGSADDLADKLTFMIDNKAQVHRYAKNGYLLLHQKYDINLLALELAGFLRSVIQYDI